MDDFIIVRQHNSGTFRDVFMIPLNDSGTSQAIQVADLPDNSVSFGTIFDGYRRSVLYCVLGVIYSVSIDDDTETILADLCKHVCHVSHNALDYNLLFTCLVLPPTEGILLWVCLSVCTCVCYTFTLKHLGAC